MPQKAYLKKLDKRMATFGGFAPDGKVLVSVEGETMNRILPVEEWDQLPIWDGPLPPGVSSVYP
jgi:hypothetical protein